MHWFWGQKVKGHGVIKCAACVGLQVDMRLNILKLKHIYNDAELK